jgi:Mrp family chromosome partitioning ATPase
LYEAALVQLSEVTTGERYNATSARVITSATLPDRPGPKRKLLYPAAVITATLIFLVGVWLIEKLRGGFRAPAAVEQATGYTVLGLIPIISDTGSGAIDSRPREPASGWRTLGLVDETVAPWPQGTVFAPNWWRRLAGRAPKFMSSIVGRHVENQASEAWPQCFAAFIRHTVFTPNCWRQLTGRAPYSQCAVFAPNWWRQLAGRIPQFMSSAVDRHSGNQASDHRRQQRTSITLEGLMKVMLREPRGLLRDAVRAGQTISRLSGVPAANVVAVVSALPGEGKSATALLMATSTSMSGLRTVLLDCDPRRSSLSAVFGTNVLGSDSKSYAEEPSRVFQQRSQGPQSGGCDRDDGLTPRRTKVRSAPPDTPPTRAIRGGGRESQYGRFHEDPCSGLTVISVNPAVLDDHAQGATLRELIAQLSVEFDHVVMDLPPLLGATADALYGAGVAHQIMLVVEWGRTSRSHVFEALRLLRFHQRLIAGIILNKVDYEQLPTYGVYGYGTSKDYSAPT